MHQPEKIRWRDFQGIDCTVKDYGGKIFSAIDQVEGNMRDYTMKMDNSILVHNTQANAIFNILALEAT